MGLCIIRWRYDSIGMAQNTLYFVIRNPNTIVLIPYGNVILSIDEEQVPCVAVILKHPITHHSLSLSISLQEPGSQTVPPCHTSRVP